ncbi:MAG: MMPL family transporter [Solirubrobacteraceae bacterium]
MTGSLRRSHRSQTVTPASTFGEAGSASTDKALTKLFTQQLSQAGVRSLQLTLVILVLVFGSLLAAWVPLMLGLQAVIATMGITNIISHITPMDQNVQSVVLLIGLAVGVDYTLFCLRGDREERAAGRSERAALEAAAATSGRSVLVSGLTVIIAMAGMLLAGGQTFVSFSIATMIVVAVAMIGSLTVLPALLAWLGDRVEKGRSPLLGRHRRPVGEGRIWSKVLTPALRHPVVSATMAAALLIAIAIPTLSLHTAQDGPKALPRSAPTIETLDRLQAAFPGQASPAIVAVKTDTNAPAVHGRARRSGGRARRKPPGLRRDQHGHQPRAYGRGDPGPATRERHRHNLDRRAVEVARAAAAADRRQDPRRRLRPH